MLFKRLLPTFAFLLLLAAPVYAQQTTLTCTTGQVCYDSNGNQIFGGSSIVTQQPDTNSGANNGIFGTTNVLTDTNTGNNAVLINSYIYGNDNTLSASSGQNQITGSYNNASGTLGLLQINGFYNSVQSNDANISINGTNNSVTGSTGTNWGLTITGGSNIFTNSTGTYTGVDNTVTNSAQSQVTGESNVLTNTLQSAVTGTANNVAAASAFVYGDQNAVPVTATGSVTAGQANNNGAQNGVIIGQVSTLGATATNGIILGNNNTTQNPNNIIIGSGNTLNCTNCAAFGSGITNTEDSTVEFSSQRLTNIGNGIDPLDAVNMSQLSAGISAFGGGAGYVNGQFVAPNYTFGTNSFNNVGSALSFLYGLDGSSGGTPGPVGPTGPTGPTGPQGPAGTNGTGNGTDPLAVHYDNSTDSSVTLQGANGTTISNVAPGAVNANSMQAVNGSQLYNAEQAANSYTDQQVQRAENWAQAYTNQQDQVLNTRINDSEAMSAAMTNMTASFAGQNPNNHNRVSAGIGFAGGSNAIAVGYQHVNDAGNFAWNVGGSAGGRDREIGAGAGFSW